MLKKIIKYFNFVVIFSVLSCQSNLQTEGVNILKTIKHRQDSSIIIEDFIFIRKDNFPNDISEFSFFNKDSTQYIFYFDNLAGTLYHRIFERRTNDGFSYQGFNGKDTFFHFESPKKLPLIYYRSSSRSHEDKIVVKSGKYFLNHYYQFDSKIAPRYLMNSHQKYFYHKNEDSLMKVKGDMELPILPEDTTHDLNTLFISDFEME